MAIEENSDRNNPRAHREPHAIAEMAVAMHVENLFSNAPDEFDRVRSYIAKNLGLHQPLAAVSAADEIEIGKALAAAFAKAVRTAFTMCINYDTAEEAADAVIRAATVKIDKGSKHHGL